MQCLLADVLPGQHFAAGLTLKAAQVPLSVQRKEGLSVLDVSATSCAICETQKCNVFKKKKKWKRTRHSLKGLAALTTACLARHFSVLTHDTRW